MERIFLRTFEEHDQEITSYLRWFVDEFMTASYLPDKNCNINEK